MPQCSGKRWGLVLISFLLRLQKCDCVCNPSQAPQEWSPSRPSRAHPIPTAPIGLHHLDQTLLSFPYLLQILLQKLRESPHSRKCLKNPLKETAPRSSPSSLPQKARLPFQGKQRESAFDIFSPMLNAQALLPGWRKYPARPGPMVGVRLASPRVMLTVAREASTARHHLEAL